MVTWLRNPQAVMQGNATPDLGPAEREAGVVAARLYTLDRGSRRQRQARKTPPAR